MTISSEYVRKSPRHRGRWAQLPKRDDDDDDYWRWASDDDEKPASWTRNAPRRLFLVDSHVPIREWMTSILILLGHDATLENAPESIILDRERGTTWRSGFKWRCNLALERRD